MRMVALIALTLVGLTACSQGPSGLATGHAFHVCLRCGGDSPPDIT